MVEQAGELQTDILARGLMGTHAIDLLLKENQKERLMRKIRTKIYCP